MLKGLINVWETVSSTFGDVWSWLTSTPAELYAPLEQKLLESLTEWANNVLSLGGGDRNPFNDLAHGILDETVNSFLESFITFPTIFFENVLDFPLISILFGGGLIFCLGYRLVMWILDIIP